MSNQTGIIYKATSPSNKCYIGKHNTNRLEDRKKGHQNSYKRFIKEKIILSEKYKNLPNMDRFKLVPKGYCTALCNAFTKYGFENFTWEILKSNVKLDDLNDEEDKFIRQYNSMDPNYGYNLKMNQGEKHKATSVETRERMSNTHRNNLHKSRKNVEELKDMPAHVTYFDSNGLRGYRIVRHPNIPSKEFADFTTPVEELKKQTLAFLEKYKDTKFETVQQRKAKTGVPKGISKIKKQDAYLVQFAYKGTKYHRFFKVHNNEDSVALNQAIEWMNDKKKLLKSQLPKQKTICYGNASTNIGRLMELFNVIDYIKNN